MFSTCRSRRACRRIIRCAVRRITDRALERISPQLGTLYVQFGRPSIARRSCSGRCCCRRCTIRSERRLIEQIDYNLLFRWFVGLGMDDAVWADDVHEESRLAARRRHRRRVFRRGVAPRRHRAAASDEHFTVDGTLLEAGQPEELAATRTDHAGRWQSDGEFPRPAAHERDAPVDDHRPHCARRRGARRGSAIWAMCSWSTDPADRARHGHAGRWLRRARRRPRTPKACRAIAASRSRPTRATTRGISSRTCARCTPRHIAQQTTGRRSAIDGRTTRMRLCDQSAETEARRAGLRLDGRRSAGCGSCGIAGGRLVTWVFTFTAAAYNISTAATAARHRLTPATSGARAASRPRLARRAGHRTEDVRDGIHYLGNLLEVLGARC